MKRTLGITLLSLFALISVDISAQQSISDLWEEVSHYEEKGLPQSAIKVVDSIYQLSIDQEKEEDLIKAVIYRMKLNNYYQENQLPEFIASLLSDVERYNGEMKALTHVLIAKMYLMYYQGNSWQIAQRMSTGEFAEDDIETWTTDDFEKAILKQYEHALSEPEVLYHSSILKFPELISQNEYARLIQPTLLDFIVHDAVNVLLRPMNYYAQPKTEVIESESFFHDARLFMYQDITLKDEQMNAIMTFLQILMKEQHKGEYVYSKVYTDLRRLEIVKARSSSKNASQLMFNALYALRDKYKSDLAVSEVDYALAQWYRSKGAEIQHIPGDTSKAFYLGKAYDVCDIIILEHPNSRPAQLANHLQNDLSTKSMSMQMDDYVMPEKDFPIFISYTNIGELHVQIYKIDPDRFKNINRNSYGEKRLDKLVKAAELVTSDHVELPGKVDYVQHSTEYLSEGLPTGFYFMIFSVNALDSEENYVLMKSFSVTSLSWMTDTYTDDDFLQLIVTDREKGNPLKDVKVTMFREKYNYRVGKYEYQRLASGTTAKDGRFCNAIKKDYATYAFMLETKHEKIMTGSEYYYNYNYYYNSKQKKQVDVHMFTDRAVYRPNQKIHVKGIVVESQGKHHEILPNYRTTVFLYDPNYQLIAQKQVKANEYGSFSTDFHILDGLLNGNLQIKVGNSSKSVRLEEYKRPAFEVKMDDFDGNYKLTQKVSVSGVASSYTGAKITDANVKYRVFAQANFYNPWRWYYYPVQREMVTFGETKTNQDGAFEIDFTADPLPGFPESPDVSFTYSIEVDVTDMTGETQSDNANLTVGYRSLLINTNFGEKVDISELDSVMIYTQNLNGQKVDAEGSLQFYRLKAPGKLLMSRRWEMPEYAMYSKEEWSNRLPNNAFKDEDLIHNFPVDHQVISIPFDTEKSNTIGIPQVEKLTAGVYKIEIRAKDAFGLPVIEKEYIRITDQGNKTVMAHVPLELRVNNESLQYHPGETLEIGIGSGLKQSMAYVIVEHENKVLFRDWLKLDGEIKKLSYDIDENMRGGILLSAYLVSNGRFFTQSMNLTVPYDNKQLDMELIHFRDEVLPGAEEQIVMKIRGHKGEKLAAEVLATMYDESLDAFYANNFYFTLFYPQYPSRNFSQSAFSYSSSSYLVNSIDQEYVSIQGTPPGLNLFGLNYYGTYYDYRYERNSLVGGNGRGVVMRSSTGSAKTAELDGAVMMAEAEELMLVDEVSASDSKTLSNSADQDKMNVSQQQAGEKDQSGEVQVRSNFNETAFFYPQLQTDANGDLSFTFTAPESLTRWKFLALAHTKDLKTGVTEKQMVTKKQLMVVPNMPRFFREGDSMNLQIKISNLSDDLQEGQCSIKLTDVMTGKDITSELMVAGAEKAFNVDAGGNTLVLFDLNIPEGVQAIEYELIAKTGMYGDGERKIVPVLSNRMLVTESMPMYVNGNSTKTWKFKKLMDSKSGGSMRHHQLSLEMTPRPAWYAVQALPYLMEYPYECSEQIFSRFYANSLATYIANSDPKIKSIFEAWKAIPESDALRSNLQKNEDLKAIMLQQTPWVLQAQNESERKRRVGLLFDMHKMSRELQSSLSKLEKRQKGNGAWPWFDGMPESRYITQHIVAGLGHLKHLNVLDEAYQSRVDAMLRHASQYLDNQILKDYRQLKRYYDEDEMKENHLSYIHIHYLYTRSFTTDIQSVGPAAAEAYQYFYSQAKTYWVEFNPYSKAMISLVVHRADDIMQAKSIIASLKEYAIVDDEMGMYWKANAGYFWYQAPIETQALLIEAFDEVTGDMESVERMKQWLLNQKRTQDWKTTKATTEAIYALILTGADLLDLGSTVIVEIGGEIYNPTTDPDVQADAGTGYFRKNWHGDEIKPEMGEVKLVKKGEGMAWGALHWQYFEDLDKITSHETPLQLEKKLFRKIATEDGMELELVEDGESFEVGDQLVVRVILRSDRDMEYVHMKDMRAACLEPVSTRSGYHYQDGLGYYQSIRDASVDFFFSWLSKGTYVFEYPLFVTHTGDFSNGITSIQCMYAPEFNSHSEGVRIQVK